MLSVGISQFAMLVLLALLIVAVVALIRTRMVLVRLTHLLEAEHQARQAAENQRRMLEEQRSAEYRALYRAELDRHPR